MSKVYMTLGLMLHLKPRLTYLVYRLSPVNVHATHLSQLLQSFDCQQHVDQSTHTAGHALDPVITHTDTSVSDFVSALLNF